MSEKNDKKYNKTIKSYYKEKKEKAVDKRGKNNANQSDACKYAAKCGGCAYQGIEYAKQLKQKKKWVQELLEPYCKVEKIIGMDNPYHYRHKVHAAFGHVKGKGVVAGVYKAGTHQIVDIESCQIENEKADAIIRDIKGLLVSFKIKTYDEDNGYGLLRHVLVRCGYHTGEYMVVLVLASSILPSKNNFVKALRKLHPEITTVVINVNSMRTSMVLGERNTTIYGKGYIEDELCGKRFRISPASFYQVNPKQTEILYRTALDLVEFTGTERVIDAYCGTGTIGIIASERAGEVIGVELNRDAVRDAVTNAKMNHVKNISFYSEDAGKFMRELSDSGDKAELVIMDPPRSGSSEEFLASLVKLLPKQVLYISCNPETLARDLKYLTKNNYGVKKAVAVDLFPFASHVECVTLLQRKNT
jgi:23S rRNA (uracil1939-C5)-methyltransferase